jgi:hypothetical protein
MSLSHGPSPVTSGLIACIDAANPKSYPGSGTAVYDISGNRNHATINGTVSYVNAGSGSYFNWATQADSNYIYSANSLSYVDITIVFQPDFTLTSGANLAMLISNGAATDKSMRFSNANGTGPWAISNPDNTDGWASGTATTYYINGIAYTGSGNLSSGWNILGAYRTNQSVYPLSSPYYLGTGYASRGYRGRIAAMYLYNRQLTAVEQIQNFNAIRGRYGL